MKRLMITAARSLLFSGMLIQLPGCKDTQSSSAKNPSVDPPARPARKVASSSPRSAPVTSRNIEDNLIGYWAPDLEASLRRSNLPETGDGARSLMMRILESLLVEISSKGAFSIHMLGERVTNSYVVSFADIENEILHVETTRAGEEQTPGTATFQLAGDTLIFTTGEAGAMKELVLSRIDQTTFETRLGLNVSGLQDQAPAGPADEE